MTTAKKILGTAFGEEESKLYVDDVFSTYLYTGNGSTQTINNGIDLAGEGGLVWVKCRNLSENHRLFDTARGAGNALASNTTAAQGAASGLSSFLSNGFAGQQDSGSTYASWTFRRSPKFFDVVTYTGNGVAGRQIPHELGVEPGMVIVKRTDTSGNWLTWHRGLSAGNYIALNSTAVQASAGAATAFGNGTTTVDPTATVLTIGSTAELNASGGSFVAYLFAHDDSEDGIIQCGSFTTDGSGNATVNLGWEPQWLMHKSSSSSVRNWDIQDSMRELSNTSTARLFANLSNAETVSSSAFIVPSSTGFSIKSLDANTTLIYLAIRRPNKPPTSGTQVYNAIARTGTGSAANITGVGFAPDAVFARGQKNNPSGNLGVVSKLVGPSRNLWTHITNAEGTASSTQDVTAFNPDGISVGTPWQNFTNIGSALDHLWFFRRAPGFMDVVCGQATSYRYTGAHNLAVTAEFIIVFDRTSAYDHVVYHKDLGVAQQLHLNSVNAAAAAAAASWSVSSTSFSTPKVTAYGSDNVVAYLFASLPGISKVGSYTGNGSSQTIDCGFTTGARFILIKRTDSTGDWYIWDTARGIVAANDPHLSLNTTAAEVTTDDSVDPEATGFIVNQVAATNINVSGGKYMFLAIA